MKRVALALVAHFGSLRTTLIALALLSAAAVAVSAAGTAAAPALAMATVLLALNLATAIATQPVFRRQMPLLVFHLALLALPALVALGRLTALDGRFELTQGTTFDGGLLESAVDRWHRDGLAQLGLRNDGFEIDYAPGRQRGATRNRVSWKGDDGRLHAALIGDHRPLLASGYRIYTTPNKGYAPVLTWRPLGGDAVTGAVHLPPYPAHELRQSREWLLPDGPNVWIMLPIERSPIDPATHARFALPDSQRLVVRVGTQRAELEPGDTLTLAEGELAYEGLRTWMGYRVTHDWTLPWMLAAALLATASLCWHATRRVLIGRRSAAAPGRVVEPPARGAFDV